MGVAADAIGGAADSLTVPGKVIDYVADVGQGDVLVAWRIKRGSSFSHSGEGAAPGVPLASSNTRYALIEGRLVDKVISVGQFDGVIVRFSMWGVATDHSDTTADIASLIKRVLEQVVEQQLVMVRPARLVALDLDPDQSRVGTWTDREKNGTARARARRDDVSGKRLAQVAGGVASRFVGIPGSSMQ